ncbi:MAG: short-chain dehydrogenase [Deltaproteobacteria bacterium]|nr:MAG: short-chain dehydrogenase [Deltaproteobacteria bacterium]
MMKLTGKVAIVTGSSRGIGKAIAIGFAKEGASVALAARSEEDTPKLPGTIYKTAAEIRSFGGKALPVKCNVADEKSVTRMVEQVLNEFGHIDILVNNAGIAFSAPLLETPTKRWELVIRVNLMGTFFCTKAVLSPMIKQGHGSIINISSVAASARGTSLPGLAYGVSKAAIERFTCGLAAEVGKYNIAVNAIKPKGIVDTEGMRFMFPNADRSQWISPDKMVKAAIFLASQDAKGVTGTVAFDEDICAWHGLL